MPEKRISRSTTFKDAYKGTWAAGAKKETRVKELIEKHCAVAVESIGFGAGSEEYIEGSSGSHGFEKAAPDLGIVGSNIVVEVTGPLTRVGVGEDLLINPEKVAYAKNHPELDYWIAHVNGAGPKAAIRMIHIAEIFAAEELSGKIVRDFQRTRTGKMMFFAVPPTSNAISWFATFVAYVKHQRNSL